MARSPLSGRAVGLRLDRPFSRRFGTGGNQIVERATGNARIGRFRVPDDAGFVDCLAGQPEVFTVRQRNTAIPAVRLNLAPLLRSIVFIGQSPLGEGFDFQRVGLRAWCEQKLQTHHASRGYPEPKKAVPLR